MVLGSYDEADVIFKSEIVDRDRIAGELKRDKLKSSLAHRDRSFRCGAGMLP